MLSFVTFSIMISSVPMKHLDVCFGIGGVSANFINKIDEKIEFELRNRDTKLKIRLSEEDKTVSSKNLKIHYFEVFFSDIWR